MTINVWEKISHLAEQFNHLLEKSGDPWVVQNPNYDWDNVIYKSNHYRRAHVEVVDRRDSHKIYILHCTVFPHYNDSSPIFGFDAVCGPNKITGAFLDYSAAGDRDHFMMRWFGEQTQDLAWNKPRELPEWAQAIFSPAMVAAGNVNTEEELDLLCHLALRTFDYYLSNVGRSQESGSDYHMAQNRYCRYQKQNPHVVRSMVAMGVSEPVITEFVENILFPETV
jgi:hypothetical protein